MDTETLSRKGEMMTPEEARAWTPIVRRLALHRQILAVARTRIEGKWAAYIAPVPGVDHSIEQGDVLSTGRKLPESIARCMFGQFDELPYAR